MTSKGAKTQSLKRFPLCVFAPFASLRDFLAPKTNFSILVFPGRTTTKMNLKGRGAAFLGFAALVGLFAFNHWLFSKWMGTPYWRWYLANGTLIELITPLVFQAG